LSRRTYGTNSYITACDGLVDSLDTTITVDSVANLTAPGYITIDPFLPATREVIKFTVINSLTLEGLTRGLAGSAGGVPQDHADNAVVIEAPTEQLVDDIFSDIEDLETADTTHAAGASAHHSKYTDGEAIAAAQNDPDAVHDNVAGEISIITAKGTPTTADFLLIEDAAAANAKKRTTIGDLPLDSAGVTAQILADDDYVKNTGDEITGTQALASKLVRSIYVSASAPGTPDTGLVWLDTT
jgi:hypothetical protein